MKEITDYYKTKGRGRQGEAVVHDDYKHSFTQVIAPSSDVGSNPVGSLERSAGLVNRQAKLRRLQRLKRSRKVRGLSARQLVERKMSLRTAKKLKQEGSATAKSVAQSLNQTIIREASL